MNDEMKIKLQFNLLRLAGMLDTDNKEVIRKFKENIAIEFKRNYDSYIDHLIKESKEKK